MTESAATSRIGVTGLAVMGANLARNIARRGIPVAVHNRNSARTKVFMEAYGDEGASPRRTARGLRGRPRAPAPDHRHGQGREGRSMP